MFLDKHTKVKLWWRVTVYIDDHYKPVKKIHMKADQ